MRLSRRTLVATGGVLVTAGMLAVGISASSSEQASVAAEPSAPPARGVGRGSTALPAPESPPEAPSTGEASSPAQPAGEGVRTAPGPEHPEGLPPPAVPPEPREPDPAIDEYRERSENVPASVQVTYVRRSLELLDTTLESLEGRLAEIGPGSAEGRRLTIRLERMRSAREERRAELESLEARAREEGEAADGEETVER